MAWHLLALATPLRAGVCGGKPLAPQSFPPFLDTYHTRSIELTEAAISDDSLRVTRGVAYGPAPHQLLDVWAPAESDESTPMPIVVGIHGGGWEYGYPEWAGFPALHICKASALYVTPAYSLGEGHRQAWPDSRDDLLLALRWLSTHAGEFSADASKLVLTGHSAGGHLASCLALNPRLLVEAGLRPEAIKACFLVSCPLGLRAEDFAPKRWLWRLWIARWIGRPLVRKLYARVAPQLRAVIGSPPDAAAAAEASVLVSVCEADPAALPALVHLSYGLQGDFPFCRPQARRLQALLEALPPGGPHVEILELADAGHFDTHYELADGSSEWHAALRRCLAEISTAS